MLNNNHIKNKLNNGETVLGTWSILPSTEATDIICSAGLDFIIIDSEHGPISFETAQNMAMVCDSRGVSPIMRVPSIDEADILKALDIGMHGIQIPNIETRENIEEIVKYAKYPPIGERGFSPFTRSGNYSNKGEPVTEIANNNTLIGINIESENAIKNIDQILEVDQLDIVFIGLFDLSKSLGMPGDVLNPKVQMKLEELTYKIIESGKYPGTIATNIESLIKYEKLGIKYLLYLVDSVMLKAAYELPVNELNKLR